MVTTTSEFAIVALALTVGCVLGRRVHDGQSGSTVGQAWVRAWYFEKCCQLQMDVLKSSRPYRVLSTEQLESSKASLDAEFPPGVHEWPAVLRRWEAEGVARWRSQL